MNLETEGSEREPSNLYVSLLSKQSVPALKKLHL